MTITTTAGDELDVLLAARYGGERVNQALAAVLVANLGLAQHGNRPPAGTRIILPDLPADVGGRAATSILSARPRNTYPA